MHNLCSMISSALRVRACEIAMLMLACVASVSNRVIARKSERKQKKSSFFPLPLPCHIFFCSCPSFLSEPREETLATQAMLMLASPCQPKVVFHSFLCYYNYCCTCTAPAPPPPQPHVSNLNLSFYCPFTDWSHSNVLKKVSCKHAGCYVVVVLRQLF